jgi:phosphatidylinositol dimannoside acyltransferase
MSGPDRDAETLRERLIYEGYVGAAWLARTLPEPVGRSAFRSAGRLAHRWIARMRATVEANQAQVLGLDPDDPLVESAAREAFDLYARYWYESFRAPLMSPEEVSRRFWMEGNEAIDRALESGKGCITTLPHMGNWDVAGRWVSAKYPKLASVAEDLKPRRLTELFAEHRQTLGMRIVPLSPKGNVGQQLASLLADNWIVALVADRDFDGRGVEVEMFGRTRVLPAGPALLSITSGAPLLVCPVFTTDDGWHCRIRHIEFERTGDLRGDVRELTRRMAAAFEDAIAAKPPDWHMFQPGWDR